MDINNEIKEIKSQINENQNKRASTHFGSELWSYYNDEIKQLRTIYNTLLQKLANGMQK